MVDETFGARVRRVREHAQISRDKLVEIINASAGQPVLTNTKLTNLERGRKPKFEEQAALDAWLVTQADPAAPAGAQPPPSGVVSVAHVVPGSTPAVPPGMPQLDVDPATGEIIQPAGAVAVAPPVEPPPANPIDVEMQQVLDAGGALYTNSELKAFKRCRRKWYLSWYRRLVPAREDIHGARALGTRVHLALSGMYVPDGAIPLDPMRVLEATIAEDLEAMGMRVAAAQATGEQLDDLVKECDLARAMIEGYLDWLSETGADADLTVVAPETKLVAQLGTAPGGRLIALLGKLDLRVRRGVDNASLFLDHKTVKDFRATKTLHLDEQMLHYDLLEFLRHMQAGGDPAAASRTDGGIYNMLRKVKRTANAKPPFFLRHEVRHSIEVLRSYYLRVWQEVLDIESVRARLDGGEDMRGVAYPNPTRDCSWDCDHFMVCPMFDDGSRVEDFIASAYVQINPLKRYETNDTDDTKELA